jgi:hypothetical protein
MAYNFADTISYLDNIGFYEVALPFLLVFTVVFAILQKIKLFGAESKKFNAVIALIMAFLVVRTGAIVEVMNLFLPKISLIAIIIISILLLLGILLGKEQTSFTGPLGGIAVILALGGVIVSFLSSSGALGINLPTWIQSTRIDFNLLIGILLFFGFIMFITSEPGKAPSFSNVMKGIVDSIGKGGKK